MILTPTVFRGMIFLGGFVVVLGIYTANDVVMLCGSGIAIVAKLTQMFG